MATWRIEYEDNAGRTLAVGEVRCPDEGAVTPLAVWDAVRALRLDLLRAVPIADLPRVTAGLFHRVRRIDKPACDVCGVRCADLRTSTDGKRVCYVTCSAESP